MDPLIKAYFRRDLSAAEESRLQRLLEGSEKAALDFSRAAERHYKSLGLAAASTFVAVELKRQAAGGGWASKLLGLGKLGAVKAVVATSLVVAAGGGYWAVHSQQAQPAKEGDGLVIELSLPSRQALAVAVFDVNGTLVRDFGSKPYSAGEQTLLWDGLGDDAQPVSPGRYRVVVTTPKGDRLEHWLEVR